MSRVRSLMDAHRDATRARRVSDAEAVTDRLEELRAQAEAAKTVASLRDVLVALIDEVQIKRP